MYTYYVRHTELLQYNFCNDSIGVTEFFVLQNVQIRSGDHPNSYSMRTGYIAARA